MRNVSVPAPSLRGQSASLRGFPDWPRRQLPKSLIRLSLLAIGRGFLAADRFFSLSSGRKARSGNARDGSEEAEAAQCSARDQDPQWTEPGREHQTHGGRRNRGTRPPVVRSTGHDITAGDDEPDRQRSEAEPHDALPRHITKPVPQTEGSVIHRAWRPECRERTGNGTRNSAQFQPDQTHHQDHIGPWHHLRDRKKIREFPIGHPAVGGDKIVHIGKNRRKPAKADRREQCQMPGQYDGRRRAVHGALALAIPATAMLAGAKPSRTKSRGSLVNAMPAKASAAKSNAVRRLRCGSKSRIPVAIISPAAAAESPPRMFCRTAR